MRITTTIRAAVTATLLGACSQSSADLPTQAPAPDAKAAASARPNVFVDGSGAANKRTFTIDMRYLQRDVTTCSGEAVTAEGTLRTTYLRDFGNRYIEITTEQFTGHAYLADGTRLAVQDWRNVPNPDNSSAYSGGTPFNGAQFTLITLVQYRLSGAKTNEMHLLRRFVTYTASETAPTGYDIVTRFVEVDRNCL